MRPCGRISSVSEDHMPWGRGRVTSDLRRDGPRPNSAPVTLSLVTLFGGPALLPPVTLSLVTLFGAVGILVPGCRLRPQQPLLPATRLLY